MPSKKNFPEKIKEFDEHEPGIPMKINYNKRSSFLQGSPDLIEEVNRTLQMMKCVNAEDQIERVIVDREGVGGAHLEFNSVGDPFISCISFCKVNHNWGEINSLKPNPRDGLSHKDGENSRTRSHIDGPSFLNPLRHDPLENPSAGESHIPSGHPVIIFREFLVLNDAGGLWNPLFHYTVSLPLTLPLSPRESLPAPPSVY